MCTAEGEIFLHSGWRAVDASVWSVPLHARMVHRTPWGRLHGPVTFQYAIRFAFGRWRMEQEGGG